MAAKMSLLWLILSYSPYLRSALGGWPFEEENLDFKTYLTVLVLFNTAVCRAMGAIATGRHHPGCGGELEAMFRAVQARHWGQQGRASVMSHESLQAVGDTNKVHTFRVPLPWRMHVAGSSLPPSSAKKCEKHRRLVADLQVLFLILKRCSTLKILLLKDLWKTQVKPKKITQNMHISKRN